jgi:acyl-CoA reductase-like NAD-dependent aldehyde dehydrogenase
MAAKRITHLIFVLSGNNPCVVLDSVPKPKKTGIKRQSAAVEIADHAAFIESVFETHGSRS